MFKPCPSNEKILIAAVVALALAGVGVWQFAGAAKTAPDVSFTSLTGETITTQDLRGKVVLVKFWATSCTTCIAQMPDAIDNYNTLAPRGFETIAVAMQYDRPDYVLNYAKTRKLPFTVAIDSKGTIAQAFGNVQLTPTAFLIDKEGNIIKRYVGNYDKLAFLRTVNQALAS